VQPRVSADQAKLMAATPLASTRSSQIRPIALCLFLHRGRILVFRGYDAVKRAHYDRPLGGGIEFGETSRDAVVREIREELGAEIEDVKCLGTLESIFDLEGETGHEIVFVFDAAFADRSLYEEEVLDGHEHEATFHAEWQSLDELAHGEAKLVPEGLAALIQDYRREQ
jgi:8-oxo-dGTP pyrophosphatase MutT (NUDIX family)